MHIDLGVPYLTQQAITYLGNKRKHLNTIDSALTKIIANDPLLSRRLASGKATAADPFSGSGIVGRLLRSRNFIVHANDIEPYTHAINTAWLTTDCHKLEKYFELPAKWLAKRLGIKVKKPYYNWVLTQLNALSMPQRKYFSTHYAPEKTAAPCFDSERVFYTQENARRLDSWMEVLHQPFWKKHKEAWSILVASVLYQMSTNVNTSGTMKAFHRGWGGPYGDSLGRIMAPMKLQPLPLVSGPVAVVSCADARSIPDLPAGQIDIVYLDPPSHQQQYSSNYHLLSSFCNNGAYDPGPVVHGTRAGIPPDHYRSQYCKSRAAHYEMTELIEYWSEKSRYIVCTYDSNGLLSYEEVFKLLQYEGENKVDFVKYGDGGKETLFIVKTKTRVSTHFHETRAVKLNDKPEIVPIKHKYVCPIRLTQSFKVCATKSGWSVYDNCVKLFSITYDYKVNDVNINAYSPEAAKAITSSILDKNSLIEKYLSDGRIDYALKIISTMKKPLEKKNAAQWLILLNDDPIVTMSSRHRRKLDYCCGKVLQRTVTDLVDQTKR